MKLLPRKPINADSNVGRGIEFALAVLIFLGLGYLLDNWLGTRPVFMIVLFLVAVVGQFAAMWYRYEASMALHDAERSAGNHQHTISSETTTQQSSQQTTTHQTTTHQTTTHQRGTA